MLFTLITTVLFVTSVYSLKLAIIGSGPTGLLLASRLLAEPELETIDIFEARDDPRLITDHRSFAIGMNNRSYAALSESDERLPDFLRQTSCSLINSTHFVTEKSRKDISITLAKVRHMTTQPLITSGLLNWIDLHSKNNKCKINFHFKTKCISINANEGILYYTKNKKDNDVLNNQYDLIVGADGGNSISRQSIIQQSDVKYEGYQTAVKWKFIPVLLDNVVNSSIFYNYKNIIGGAWYMPSGKTHLVTFWTSKSKDDEMNHIAMKSINDIKTFFNIIFNNKLKNIDDAANEYYTTKPSNEYIFKINKYYHNSGKLVIVGDAAHTMSSALGQGMSCGLCDANYLYCCLKKYNFKNILSSMKEYSDERVKEGNAITDLNFVNYIRSNIIFNIYQLILKFIFRKKVFSEDIFNSEKKYSEIAKGYKYWILKGLKIAQLRMSAKTN